MSNSLEDNLDSQQGKILFWFSEGACFERKTMWYEIEIHFMSIPNAQTYD